MWNRSKIYMCLEVITHNGRTCLKKLSDFQGSSVGQSYSSWIHTLCLSERRRLIEVCENMNFEWFEVIGLNAYNKNVTQYLRLTILVGIIGSPGSGKLTLLTTLYYSFIHNLFASTHFLYKIQQRQLISKSGKKCIQNEQPICKKF